MSYSVTIAILSALHDRSIPLDQIGFIGIDDMEFASFLNPSLSAVAQPAEQFAELAVERLLEHIHGAAGGPVQVTLPGKFIVRASCGCDPALSRQRERCTAHQRRLRLAYLRTLRYYRGVLLRTQGNTRRANLNTASRE